MRTINVNTITENIKDMCIQANHFLAEDMDKAMKHALETEEAPLGRQILDQLQDNLKIAAEDMIPICQDTGMAVVFLEIGQDVHFEGGNLEDAVNEGIRRGYVDGYLRKSVVRDPIDRVNTKDNTPAIIHYEIVDGDQVDITVAPKGFGSENMSRIAMMNPTSGEDDIIRFIVETVKSAGGNPCPPTVIGVGIGGSFDYAAFLAKKALSRPVGVIDDSRESRLERRILKALNKTGVGPQGLGGDTTSLWVNVETYPTHIASLPVAVNVSCHATRHDRTEL